MVPFAALLLASALARPAVPETRQQIEKPLPEAVARVVAYHSSGNVTVRTIAPGEKPRALFEIAVSGAEAKSDSAKAENAKAERRFLEGVNLTVTEENGASVVRSLFPPQDQKPAWLSFNATLTLFLPESCALSVENSYGKVTVDGRVGDVKVRNSLFPIEVGHVRGNVDVATTLAAIVVHDVEGDLIVTAKDCPVTVDAVSGSVTIRTNGSAVAVHRAGSADVETSMKSVELKAIARDARVVAPFCMVTANEIGGNLAVTSSNYPVRIGDVGGDVSVQQSRGTIEVTRAKGKATIVGSLCDTTLEEVGAAEVHCPWSLLRLTRVGSLVAENSKRTLEITDPQGDVQATAAGGLLKFRAAKLPASDKADDPAHELTLVASEGGKIELKLPPDGSYALDATSTAGQLECTLPGMDITLQGTARVGSLRRGDGKTKLHATSGGAIGVAPAQ
jgi:hypothetical protein